VPARGGGARGGRQRPVGRVRETQLPPLLRPPSPETQSPVVSDAWYVAYPAHVLQRVPSTLKLHDAGEQSPVRCVWREIFVARYGRSQHRSHWRARLRRRFDRPEWLQLKVAESARTHRHF
jgi:hypothetical protein